MATKKQSADVNAGAAEDTAKPLKFKRQAFHANADGTTETIDLTIHFYPGREQFEINLPAYLQRSNPSGLPRITESTVAGVLSIYEAICEDYSRRRLAMNGQKFLWVGTLSKPSQFTTEVFGIAAVAALGVQSVIRYVDGKFGDAIVRANDDGEPIGEPVLMLSQPIILIPDTPANRTKVQTLIDSIKQAAAVIEQARTVADPEAYIQAINDRWAAPAVVAQPPAVKPADDDEEL